MNYNFSVYHQVYSNKDLTRRSLSTLVNFYPGVKITLLCDGGCDYLDIANEFNTEYIYDTFNTGVYDTLNPKVISGEHIYGWTKEESLVFLKRIYNFAKKSNPNVKEKKIDFKNFPKNSSINIEKLRKIIK